MVAKYREITSLVGKLGGRVMRVAIIPGQIYKETCWGGTKSGRRSAVAAKTVLTVL